MAKPQQTDTFSDAERRADGRADSIAAVLLIALGVVAMVYWISGH